MADRPTLSSGSSRNGHLKAAGAVAATILAAATASLPFSRVPLASSMGFVPAVGALTLLTELLTAALLLSQALTERQRAPLRLAGAFLFSALAIAAQMTAFPGLFQAEPLLARADAAAWLWVAWHAGLALGVVWFALAAPGPLRRREVARVLGGTCLAAAAPVAAVVMDPAWLPTLPLGGTTLRLGASGMGPAVLAATAAALILVLTRLRLRCPVSVWLAVSLLATGLDVLLTLCGGGRFSFGWYVARGLSLLTGVTMLVALLSELIMQARRVGDVNEQLEQLLHTDALTGVSNRRAFDTAFDVEWRRCRRDQAPLSLLAIDIDLFKAFNDRHGHPAGDTCLQTVARALAQQLQRPADLLARLGGEEFVLLLPSTSEAGAALVAERVRDAVGAAMVAHAGRTLAGVTVSIGIATRRPSDRMAEPSLLVDAADRALYRAKESGRNRVCTEFPAVRVLPAVRVA